MEIVERAALRERLIAELDACLEHFYTSKAVEPINNHSGAIRLGLGPVILLAYGAVHRAKEAEGAPAPTVPAADLRRRKWVFILAQSAAAASEWARARGVEKRSTWVHDGNASVMEGHRDYAVVNLGSFYDNIPLSISSKVERDLRFGECVVLKPDSDIPFVS